MRNGGPVKLSVDLAVEDEAGRSWVVLMKTWQNVVSGEHRPTFVLENTGARSCVLNVLGGRMGALRWVAVMHACMDVACMRSTCSC